MHRQKSDSDSDSNLSILNRGTEPITNLLFGFVLKLGVVPQDSTVEMGMGSRFRFSVFKYGS